MKAEKDLGKLIRERLADVEVMPQSNLWNIIETSLERKRKWKLGFLWSSVLLLLFLAAFVTLQLSDGSTSSEQNQQIRNTDSKILQEDSIKTRPSFNTKKSKQSFPKTLEENKKEDNVYPSSKDKDNTPDTSSHTPKTELFDTTSDKSSNLSKPNTSEVNDSHITGKPDRKNNGDKPFPHQNGPKLNSTSNPSNPNAKIVEAEKIRDTGDNQSSDLDRNEVVNTSKGNVTERTAQKNPSLTQGENRDATTKSDKKGIKKDSLPLKPEDTASPKKYYIYPFLSSSSYGGLSRASAIDERLDGNQRSNDLSFGYGLYVVFKPNEKWGIRIGAAYSQVKKNTLDVRIRPNDLSTNYYRDITFRDNLSYLALSNTFAQPERITLQERLSYLQVPLEVTRVLLKREKFGIKAIAGVGVIYLKKNEISVIRTTGTAIELGKNDNYSEGSFGIHFGFGLDYELNRSLKIQLEPIISPQIDFYEKNIGNRPFIFNLQLGVLYRL